MKIRSLSASISLMILIGSNKMATAFGQTAAPTPAPIPIFTPLSQVLAEAISNSNALHAQKQSELVAEDRIKVAQTGYYPSVSVEAIDSTGFPGSTSPTGVTGLPGSPYRSGFAYGMVATETLWDFGTIQTQMDVAKRSSAAQQARTKIGAWTVKEDAINLYYACARAQTLQNLWTGLEADSQGVQKEVDRFVHTGQRSIVDGLLAKAQTEEATREKSRYTEQVEVIHQRLGVITGTPPSSIACPDLFDAGFTGFETSDIQNRHLDSSKLNPYLLAAEAEQRVAEAQVSSARTGYLPKLLVVGSLGEMDRSRLVPKQDYALGFGLSFPIFDGLRTPREVDTALAYKSQKEEELGAAHQFIDDTNLKFDQMIRSDKVAIDHMHQEIDDSNRAFTVARKRYIAFSGTLVDVRESIRNFSRIRAEYVDTQADWQRVLSLKAAFNGVEF